MYEFKTRTRYSEYDENGRMRLISLLNYLQNTSSYHSFDSGMSVEYYKSIQRAWLINYWDIHIEGTPGDSEYVTMGTSPHDIKGLFAYRNFWLKNTNTDAYYIRADSIWFVVNTETMSPVKPTDADIAPFGDAANVLGLKADTRKVRFDSDEGFTHIADIPVSRAVLDTNHHVNNIQYISAAFEAMIDAGYIKESAYPSRIRVEYKHAATLGDTMCLSVKHVPDAIREAASFMSEPAPKASDNNSGIQGAKMPSVTNKAAHSDKIWAALKSPDGTDYCNIELTF